MKALTPPPVKWQKCSCSTPLAQWPDNIPGQFKKERKSNLTNEIKKKSKFSYFPYQRHSPNILMKDTWQKEICFPPMMEYIYKNGLKSSYDDFLFAVDDSLLMRSKHYNTNERSLWSTRSTKLKDKSHPVKLNESILVRLLVFQPNFVLTFFS